MSLLGPVREGHALQPGLGRGRALHVPFEDAIVAGRRMWGAELPSGEEKDMHCAVRLLSGRSVLARYVLARYACPGLAMLVPFLRRPCGHVAQSVTAARTACPRLRSAMGACVEELNCRCGTGFGS